MKDAGKLITRGILVLLVLGLAAMGCSAGGTAVKKDGSEALAKLESIEVKDTDEITTVVLKLERPVTFTSVRLDEPPRMVVDLAGTDGSAVQSPISVGKGPVSSITVSKVPESSRISRLEIELGWAAGSTIAQADGTINILFENKPPARAADAPLMAPPSAEETVKVAEVAGGKAQAEQAAPASAAREDEAKAVPEATPAALPAQAAPARKAAAASVVEEVRSFKAGEGCAVSIEGNGEFKDPRVFMVGSDRLVVDLMGVGYENGKDTFDVAEGCIKRIRMAAHKEPEAKVRVVLDLKGDVEYEVRPEGSRFVVAVAASGGGRAAGVMKAALGERPEAAPAEAHAPATTVATSAKKAPAAAKSAPATGRKIGVTVARDEARPEKPVDIYISKKDDKTVLSSSPITEKAAASAGPGAKKVMADSENYVVTETKIYTGGKISFDVQDADLDKVIKLLADVAGLNLIMDPADVQGKVTLKLDDVPWDQALEILLRIYKLDKVIEGNVLRVAPKARLQEEKRRDLLQIAEQKKLEKQAEDLYTKTIKVNYSTADELVEQLKGSQILSARGNATPNPRTNEIIITDVLESLEKSEQLIRILDKEVNQIMIEARIVSVDVDYSQTLGVSWGLNRSGNVQGNEPKLGLVSGTNSSMEFQDDGSFILALPSELGKDAAGLVTGMTWTGIAKDINLDLTISALETIGKAESLAAPKVMVLENQSATITQGVTLYVQTTSAAGTRPEPLNANLSLTVTPRVTGDNLIIMDVTATNNEPASPPPGSTASIDTKSITTSIIVSDGDTMVMGGIYTKSKSNTVSEVPLLGRIPILGWLFKERTISEPTRELLIFITPKLVPTKTRQI